MANTVAGFTKISSTSSATTQAQVAFYSSATPSSESFISRIDFSNADTASVLNDVPIPNNAVLAIVFNKSSVSDSVTIEGVTKVNFASVHVDVDELKAFQAEYASFFHIGGNLVDPSTLVEGEYVNQTNGSFATNASHKRTGFVPVSPGESYCVRFDTDGDSTSIRYAFYQSNNVESYISGASVSLGNIGYMLTSPTNAHYMAVSIGDISRRFFIKKSDTKTNYEPYGNDYILPKYISDDININIPSKIYALVGYETNIYFENLVEDWTKYQWDVDCVRGMQLERGFRVTPASGETGTFNLSITAKSKSGNSIMTVKTSLIIVSGSVGSGVSKSVMILGDSTTNNGTAVTKLNENFSDDVMTVTTVGTRGTTPNNHEGRSGWKFSDYFTVETITYTDGRGTVNNPFYNPTSETFDANHYFSATDVIKPDWFFINLGINDMFNYTNDAELFEQIESCKTMCSAMITSMKEASPNTKIGVCLTIPPNHSQDAFGKAYKCAQNRDRYKRNNFLWVSVLISEYDKRESENIYIIPIFASIDTVYNMGMETLPVNARNTTMTYESPVSNGGVHPVESGYWQIADVYTAFLKANA